MNKSDTTGLPPIGSCATCGQDINYGESYIIGADRKRRHNSCHTQEDYAPKQIPSATRTKREAESNG